MTEMDQKEYKKVFADSEEVFVCFVCSPEKQKRMHLAHLMDHFAEKHLDNYHTYSCPKCPKKFGSAVSAHFHIRRVCKEDGFIQMQNYSQALLSYDVSYSIKMYSLLKQSIFKYVSACKASVLAKVKVETKETSTNTESKTLNQMETQTDPIPKPSMKSKSTATNGVKTYNIRIQTSPPEVRDCGINTTRINSATVACQTKGKMNTKSNKPTSSAGVGQDDQTKSRHSLESTNTNGTENLSIASSETIPPISDLIEDDHHEQRKSTDEAEDQKQPNITQLPSSVAVETDRQSIGLEGNNPTQPTNIKREPEEENQQAENNSVPETSNSTHQKNDYKKEPEEPATNQGTSTEQRQNGYGSYLDDFEDSMANEPNCTQNEWSMTSTCASTFPAVTRTKTATVSSVEDVTFPPIAAPSQQLNKG